MTSLKKDSEETPLLSPGDEGHIRSPTSQPSGSGDHSNRSKEFQKEAEDYKKEAEDYKKLEENRLGWKINYLAVFFALYQKAASLCGNLVFIWATVVLLGGFATTLESVDFRVVTILLLLEGVRIFCRSNEVTPTSRRSWTTDVLFCMQVLSASASIVISSYRLSIGFEDRESGVKNRNMALLIFYILCEIDAGLVLVEKFSWIILFLIRVRLLQRMLRQTSPGRDDFHLYMAFVSYFYAIYFRCLKKDVFEGSKMEFYSCIVDLLQSSDGDEQLTGVHALLKCLLINEGNANNTKKTLIRTMRTRRDVLETLIDMLNWKRDHKVKEVIRKAAARIISIFVKQNQNYVRVAAIAGSMEAIASLLYDSNPTVNNQSSPDSSDVPVDQSPPDSSDVPVDQLGLDILKSMANDPANCAKIRGIEGILLTINGLASSSKFDTACLAHELEEILARNP